MLLAADVCNTEIVLGVFRGSELAHTWRVSTQAERTADELALLLSGFLARENMSFESQVTGLVVASVVPDVTAAIRSRATITSIPNARVVAAAVALAQSATPAASAPGPMIVSTA